MTGKLRNEIRQGKPFRSREEEALLNLLRTADALSRREFALLKQYGLSPNQYNALRILRGAGNDGVTCTEISERLIERDPDVTRLLDRLEARELMRRTRDPRDRRVVRNVITAAGLALLKELDEPTAALVRTQLGHMADRELSTLIRLLERARERAGDDDV